MTTVLRQPLKAVLGMLALLLVACGESHQRDMFIRDGRKYVVK